MSFEVDRSSWAHIALCADLTWATEPPDEFIIANQRLWAQHCRVSQVLQETSIESQSLQTNQCDNTDTKRPITNPSQENGSSCSRSVKDIIPESRLAQFYGNFYYDDVRERCYSNSNERINRGFYEQGCENTDLTECWMLPEVEYWFRKLLDDSNERSMLPRRRRQYRMLPDEDLCVLFLLNFLGYSLANRVPLTLLRNYSEIIRNYAGEASERWEGRGARGEEAALWARVRSVRGLWASSAPSGAPLAPSGALHTPGGAPSAPTRAVRVPSPPPAPRKMRARRRQPRRLAAPPPINHCLDLHPQLFCDPTCKFQFDPPRPPQLVECQRAMGRLSASMQAAIRASAARCPPYRGTNVSRYAPTGQRPARYQDRRYIWWPKDHPSPRLDKLQLVQANNSKPTKTPGEETVTPVEEPKEQSVDKDPEEQTSPSSPQQEKAESPREKMIVDEQVPSTSAAAIEAGLRKKRLYSTVLSMSAPSPINLTPAGCVRLAQKLVTPGIIKLNPKIVLPGTRMRPPNVDNKFEELEKEALEQYKASDESIDTKFQELEKQAEEQYSASNSNTSCSSGNSAEKKPVNPLPENETKTSKQPAKFHKEKPVDSVVIYSQNFPDLNTKQTSSVMNLKNFHGPQRGEKKENHRMSKSRSAKGESQRAASDTDYEARESAKGHKGPVRLSLHVGPPKKRHLNVCVSDFSSDEDMEEASGSIKDAGPRAKTRAGKLKMSAHGGGDLHPIMRKT